MSNPSKRRSYQASPRPKPVCVSPSCFLLCCSNGSIRNFPVSCSYPIYYRDLLPHLSLSIFLQLRLSISSPSNTSQQYLNFSLHHNQQLILHTCLPLSSPSSPCILLLSIPDSILQHTFFHTSTPCELAAVNCLSTSLAAESMTTVVSSGTSSFK